MGKCAPMAIEKYQKSENGPNELNWQCCLAGSSKTTPKILIFSIAMGADDLFELVSIVH